MLQGKYILPRANLNSRVPAPSQATEEPAHSHSCLCSLQHMDQTPLLKREAAEGTWIKA